MSKANCWVSRVTYLSLALFLFSSMAAAIDFNKGGTVTLCDNFGKTWSVAAAACSPNLPLSVCLSGARDTKNLLGCGPLPMVGDALGVRYLFHAYINEVVSGCVSTYWVASGSGGAKSNLSGNVYNPGGLFGSFTLTSGACPASSAGASNDPSFIK